MYRARKNGAVSTISADNYPAEDNTTGRTRKTTKGTGVGEYSTTESLAVEMVGTNGFVPLAFIERHVFSKNSEEKAVRQVKVDELLNRMVDRVLLSTPTLPDASEVVQIKLVQSVFSGADIWLKRKGGELIVDIVSEDDSLRQVFEESGEELKNRIEKVMKNTVHVNLKPEPI